MPVKGYEKLLLYVAYCKLWGCSVTDRYDGFAQPVHLDSTAGTRPVLYFGYLYWIIKFSTKKYGRTFFWKRQFFSLSALKAQTSRPSWTLRTSFLPRHLYLSEITVSRRAHWYATLWAKLQPLSSRRSKRAGVDLEWLNSPVQLLHHSGPF